ncbi:Hint domain-containing protein [Tropicibacter naphthalenivorans]|uniref:Hedgehog/Intein (Hint) domain-containing protein n=1 Tax=Tropicibacter naphthalenivorans TaxID=441103 RepID=A0A0N7LYH4_9RHOB|nr:Hint domain-containing protein [Tropicibacter naphthalenivorans]CUH74873.1 hypothetical protein TRN7648_00129 [Tropicibacter naphthalenivorans]SMC48583.1 Hint domain-containing protein [Tropicibacter naphthalenivorans]
MRDDNGDGIIYDTDSDDGSAPSPATEGLVVSGVLYNAHEIGVYDNSTITVDGVDYTVRLVVTVLDNGAWGVHILDVDIQPGWYPADITAARLGTWNGVEYSGTNTSSVDQMLCFAAETPIRTPTGWRAAGALAEGDAVVTLSGTEPLVWVGRQTVAGLRGASAPITIAPGSLGAHGLIRLSPLHRVLISSPNAALLFGHPRILIAAKDLLPLPGVSQIPVDKVTYIHLMTRRHSVLRSAGLWCESFQAGTWARRRLPLPDQAKLAQLLPNPRGYGRRFRWSRPRRAAFGACDAALCCPPTAATAVVKPRLTGACPGRGASAASTRPSEQTGETARQ